MPRSLQIRRRPVRPLRQALWRFPSWFFSFVDYLFARPIAALAGATLRAPLARYGWGILVMLAAATAGLLAQPPASLIAIGVAVAVVLAIFRRWSWAETTREKYERGERGKAQRALLREDLRDEAVLALAWLVVLIPLALRQIQLITCSRGLDNCAFTLAGEMPDEPFWQLVAWLGYFGAELAKSLPFTNWSDVPGAAAGSPIQYRTQLGAQALFGMHAALDLLLFAGVVRAVQVARRLGDIEAAFRAGQPVILDPSTETRELRIAGEAIKDALGLRPDVQPSIAAFRQYSAARLREIAEEKDQDVKVRTAAAALLARQHPGKENDKFFTDFAKAESSSSFKSTILTIASGVTPDPDPTRNDEHCERLKDLLGSRKIEAAVGAAAARALGRAKPDDDTRVLLLERLKDRSEHPAVRAAAAVALAKFQVGAAAQPLRELAGSFEGPLYDLGEEDALTPVMAAAYACARVAPSERPEAIAALFAEPLQPHALRAARIQAMPANVGATKPHEAGDALDQMVRIAPGEERFDPSFLMGAPHHESALESAIYDQPQVAVTMARPFAIGRCPVTEEEYLSFRRATKPWMREEDGPEEGHSHRQPFNRATWRDALAYCDWLERITGELYRLPTEAEWEYACRAGTTWRYYWADEWREGKTSRHKLTDVGTRDANNWDLHDMVGVVFQWCADPWHESPKDRPSDGRAWLEGGEFTHRVLRGGSFYDDPQYLRSAFRDGYPTDYHDVIVGFRIARTLSR